MVRGKSKFVTDPATGRVIDQLEGRVKGKIRITAVKNESAHATILNGRAKRGDFLEPAT